MKEKKHLKEITNGFSKISKFKQFDYQTFSFRSRQPNCFPHLAHWVGWPDQPKTSLLRWDLVALGFGELHPWPVAIFCRCRRSFIHFWSLTSFNSLMTVCPVCGGMDPGSSDCALRTIRFGELHPWLRRKAHITTQDGNSSSRLVQYVNGERSLYYL
jgi:hypothetical protein